MHLNHYAMTSFLQSPVMHAPHDLNHAINAGLPTICITLFRLTFCFVSFVSPIVSLDVSTNVLFLVMLPDVLFHLDFV